MKLDQVWMQAYCAALRSFLAQGNPISEASQKASEAAGIAVGKFMDIDFGNTQQFRQSSQ